MLLQKQQVRIHTSSKFNMEHSKASRCITLVCNLLEFSSSMGIYFSRSGQKK